MQEFIDIAHYLADEAGKIVRQYYRQPFDIEIKSDESPVTIADKTVEQRLRSIIEEKRPDDGIIGEEYGIKDSKNQYTWVFDPIDGTAPFTMGRPTFGTLIALCENGVSILGIIDQPILKERWLGVRDQQTTFNGEIINTRPCAKIDEAFVTSTNPSMFEDRGLALEKHCQRSVWGSDCYGYAQLANGRIDIVAESGGGVYDYISMPPIIEGAGGHICDWNGKSLNLNSDGTVLALGDIALKDQILEILN